MSEDVTTLGSLLAPEGDATKRLLLAAGKSDGFAVMTREVLQSVLPDVAPEVEARLREVLNVPIPDLLAGAWGRYVDLLKFRDPERYPPEKVSVVGLAAHTVRSRHRPAVEIEVAGVLPTPVTLRLEFDVELSATIDGAKIAIQGGRIRKVLGGTADLTGTLFCAGEQIVSRERTVKLPGEVSLGAGVPIAPAIALGHDVPIAAPPAPATAAAEGQAPA
jgi:hypothetical protein